MFLQPIRRRHTRATAMKLRLVEIFVIGAIVLSTFVFMTFFLLRGGNTVRIPKTLQTTRFYQSHRDHVMQNRKTQREVFDKNDLKFRREKSLRRKPFEKPKTKNTKSPTPRPRKGKPLIGKRTRNGPRKRYLIYLCDHRRWCGGLGDRQRGLVSVYVLAATLKWTFGVNMTTPCNFNKFYEPNRVPWDLDEEELDGLSWRLIDDFRVDKKKFRDAIVRGELETTYKEDVIFVKTNGDLWTFIIQNKRYLKLAPSWTNSKSRAITFHNGWKHLMKPTKHMMAHYAELFDEVKGPMNDKDLVCAHVRIAKNPTMPNDGPSRFTLKDMKVLWSFVEPYVNNGSHFFLATDSEQIRKMARERFQNKEIDTGGKIVHIDRQRNKEEACDGFEVGTLEQMILSMCRVLIFSPSNFGKRAADIRGTTDNLFFFRRDTIYRLRSV